MDMGLYCQDKRKIVMVSFLWQWRDSCPPRKTWYLHNGTCLAPGSSRSHQPDRNRLEPPLITMYPQSSGMFLDEQVNHTPLGSGSNLLQKCTWKVSQVSGNRLAMSVPALVYFNFCTQSPGSWRLGAFPMGWQRKQNWTTINYRALCWSYLLGFGGPYGEPSVTVLHSFLTWVW